MTAKLTQFQEYLRINLPSPLQPLGLNHGPLNAELFVKRDDQIHPIISGNKWRKLQNVLTNYNNNKYSGIVSFGGGYSNHLHALGYVCQQLKIPFTACVRGDYSKNLTPMLKDLFAWKADVKWLSKIQYKQKSQPDFIVNEFPHLRNYLLVPEGGSSQHAITGMQQLLSELPEDINHIVCPVASGGTMSGLIQAIYDSRRDIKITGIAVLKGEDYLESLVTDIVTEPQALKTVNWQINHQYHFGGYAKTSDELLAFCDAFNTDNSIPVEPVYSGKLFFAALDMLKGNAFTGNEKVCLLHTGGLQGTR